MPFFSIGLFAIGADLLFCLPDFSLSCRIFMPCTTQVLQAAYFYSIRCSGLEGKVRQTRAAPAGAVGLCPVDLLYLFAEGRWSPETTCGRFEWRALTERLRLIKRAEVNKERTSHQKCISSGFHIFLLRAVFCWFPCCEKINYWYKLPGESAGSSMGRMPETADSLKGLLTGCR